MGRADDAPRAQRLRPYRDAIGGVASQEPVYDHLGRRKHGREEHSLEVARLAVEPEVEPARREDRLVGEGTARVVIDRARRPDRYAPLGRDQAQNGRTVGGQIGRLGDRDLRSTELKDARAVAKRDLVVTGYSREVELQHVVCGELQAVDGHLGCGVAAGTDRQALAQ